MSLQFPLFGCWATGHKPLSLLHFSILGVVSLLLQPSVFEIFHISSCTGASIRGESKNYLVLCVRLFLLEFMALLNDKDHLSCVPRAQGDVCIPCHVCFQFLWIFYSKWSVHSSYLKVRTEICPLPLHAALTNTPHLSSKLCASPDKLTMQKLFFSLWDILASIWS